MQTQSQSSSHDPELSREKRHSGRVEYRVPVSVHSVTTHRGLASNISNGGLFVVLSEPLPEGSLVELEFEMPDDGRQLRVLGEVRWTREEPGSSDDTNGMGVEFWKMGPEGRHHLNRIIGASRSPSRCGAAE